MLILSAYVNLAIVLLWGLQELFPRVHQIMLRLPGPTLTRATSFVIEFALLLLLYWRVPRVAVWPTAAVWGAALGACAGQILSWGFAWYLASGLAYYDVIYGSLGTVVALMFWMYLSGWVLLFGAHLVVALQQHALAKIAEG